MAMSHAPGDLRRYRDGTRINHWLVAILFVLAGLSGLAFFHPSMYWFTSFFGGGAWTRILHPYFGVAMTLLFLWLAVRVGRENLLGRSDLRWLASMGSMLRGEKKGMPAAGKYNAGQKVVFWLMLLSLVLLLATGVLFWHAWFPDLPVFWRRLGVLVHAIAAFVLVLTVIVHVYAGIWVKGSMRAMTRGTVSRGWAELNHPLWAREAPLADDQEGRR